MYPLLLRDGLSTPYFATVIMFLILSNAANRILELDNRKKTESSMWTHAKVFVVAASVLGMICLHAGFAMIDPPAQLPDLYPALFALYSTCNLILLYFYFVSWQLSLGTGTMDKLRGVDKLNSLKMD